MLISARRLVMLYICAKFHEIISNDIKLIKWTQFLEGKLQRGIIPPKMQVEQLLLNNSTKNAGGATVVNLCMSSVMLYISTKFCEIISKRYQSYRVDTISILKITKGNISAKNVGGVTVFNLCTSSGHALYFYQIL